MMGSARLRPAGTRVGRYLLVILTLLTSCSASTWKQRGVYSRINVARTSLTKAMLKCVTDMLDLFKFDHGRYPVSLDDFIVAPSYVKLDDYPKEGYLSEYPIDGWGNKLVFRSGKSTSSPFELVSYGADGKEGGDGYDADIVR